MGTRALHGRATRQAETAPVPVRLLVVDDHALARESMAHILGCAPGLVVVGTTGTGEEALGLMSRTRPHVAVVDIRLPGMSGLDLAERIGQDFPFTHTLLLSAYDDKAYVERALAIGVSGYLVKTASATELIEAVRSACNGTSVLDRAISKRLGRRAPPISPGSPGARNQRGAWPSERWLG